MIRFFVAFSKWLFTDGVMNNMPVWIKYERR
jgi:hypothetical protein